MLGACRGRIEILQDSDRLVVFLVTVLLLLVDAKWISFGAWMDLMSRSSSAELESVTGFCTVWAVRHTASSMLSSSSGTLVHNLGSRRDGSELKGFNAETLGASWSRETRSTSKESRLALFLSSIEPLDLCSHLGSGVERASPYKSCLRGPGFSRLVPQSSGRRTTVSDVSG